MKDGILNKDGEQKHVLFRLELDKQLKVIQVDNKIISKQFHDIYWNQILKIANFLTRICAKALFISEEKIMMEDIIGLGSNMSKVGIRAWVEEKIDQEKIDYVQHLIAKFLNEITKSTYNKENQELFEGVVSNAEQALVDKTTREFLRKDGGTNILIPYGVIVGEGNELVSCAGKYLPKPVVHITDPKKMTIRVYVDGLFKSKRILKVDMIDYEKKGKKTKRNVHFDFASQFVGVMDLLKIEDEIDIDVSCEMDAKGREIFVFISAGNRVQESLDFSGP